MDLWHLQKSSSHKGWEIDMIMSSFVFLFMAFHCLGLGLLSQILLIESDTASAIWRFSFFFYGDRSCSSPMTQFQPCSTAFQELVLPTHICAPGSRPADVSPGCELWSCPVTSSNPALPRFSSCSLSNQEEPCVYSQSQACWLQSDHGP